VADLNLEHLNPEQQKAVRTIDGPLLVLAGAGTGKTSVITYRIAWLLQHGIAPDNILAVTFTNKAANEMRERLEKLLPHIDHKLMTVSTFHSLCCKILRTDIHHIGYTRRFGIADAGDQEGLIKQVMGEMGITKGDFDVNFFKSGISHAKNFLQTVEEIRGNTNRDWAQTLADMLERYQQHLRNMNLLDFDDLLLQTLVLWREHPDVLKKYRERYTHLMVDEYQDTNKVQSELMRTLAGEKRNICVVGDDDQSIYGWRGADIANILDFQKVFKAASTVTLEQNYRSTNNILKAAGHVIGKNENRHIKQLWSDKGDGDPIRMFETDDETEESRLVARMINQVRYENRGDFGDMAILFRSNFQTRPFEQSLRDANIPYRIVGAKSFYERREIKDAVAYLRIVHNPRDDLSLLRVLNTPPRGIGDKSIAKLKEYQVVTSKPLLELMQSDNVLKDIPAGDSMRAFVAAHESAAKNFAEAGELAEKMHRYLSAMDYLDGLGRVYKSNTEGQARLENVIEFFNSAAAYNERWGGTATLQMFLEAFSLTDDHDHVDDQTADEQGVTLLTVHSAKGLEFPHVFIVGMEQNLFPHERSIRDYMVDEERRLFYVAVTRAKTNLIMTRARQRQKYDKRYRTRLSQFVHELPKDLVEFPDVTDFFAPATEDQVDDVFEQLKARFS
jgi:DNA helicase-2/ATP-dependent DNA helicase PcrA